MSKDEIYTENNENEETIGEELDLTQNNIENEIENKNLPVDNVDEENIKDEDVEKIVSEDSNFTEDKAEHNFSAKSTIIPIEQMLSNKLLIIPIIGHPFFPGLFTPLVITAEEDVKTIEQATSGDNLIGIVMQKNENEKPSISDLYEVGTVAKIIKKINLPDGGVNLFISTIKRFRIRKFLNEKEPILAIVEYLEDEEDDTFEVKALTRAILSEMKEVAENNPFFSEEMRLNMVNIDQAGKITDFITSILNIDKDEQQKILETLNVRQRMEQVLVFVKKEQELLRIQKKIQNELNDRIETQQREYFLKEELKAIKEELGITTDAQNADYQKFKEKIDSFNFTGEIKEVVDSELEKFALMDPTASEYSLVRNYLDTISSLPWNEEIKEYFEIDTAKKILDRDHYGLDDVKKRILEYLAVRKLRKDNKGSIVILVGPPGVGKTSIGRSIAEAMNKPFFRFSVGGMRDDAEIKGHRRTYIGAMPGKIIQGLKIVKSSSPVFLIDEVDKLASSHQGDPASALLEVLDPEQNISFRDNYLDLPFDISNVFFVLTANTLDTIPEPLLDRAEVIMLSGYIDQEKIEIAKKYLIPKTLIKNGLKKNQVKFDKKSLSLIAESYARESGVRNFEKYIDKIIRKIAMELVTSDNVIAVEQEIKLLKDELSKIEEVADIEEKKGLIAVAEKKLKEYLSTTFSVDAELAKKYLGMPVFDESEIKKADIPGTAIGLAWTSMGGDTLLIETVVIPGKEGFILTGQLGDVMKESASIAMNWVHKYSLEKNLKNNEWFDKNTIHIHLPEGATPKDGPSAGITLTTALISLISDKSIKPNLAMTGELSLTGQVLPIGGLREKTVAARRNKIKHIIIPKANIKDLDEIPEIVKKGISFHPVSRIEEVLEIAFN